jgi:hypothetical protein
MAMNSAAISPVRAPNQRFPKWNPRGTNRIPGKAEKRRIAQMLRPKALIHRLKRI